MAETVVGYIKEYGDYTFVERPLNDVDSLVLCQFCYLKFDSLVPGVSENKAAVSMRQVMAHADYETLYADERYEKDNRALFEAMLASKRYGKMKMNCYINIIETQWETQFSAITLFLEDGTVFIAYRGTDENIIGWKEDFNMAFRYPVPGQEYSVKYLNMVASKLKMDFYVGGHSKGGNLAMYAAMNCIEAVRDRILKIYCLDGPGFRPEILKKSNYKLIEDKIVKILPYSSLVGLIFGTDTKYQVVQSKTFGLLQHNPYTWLIEGGQFVYVEDVQPSRKFSDGTINEWLLSQGEEELKTFVDTLYKVIAASNAKRIVDFTADWKKNMNVVISALKEVDAETVKVLKAVIKSLFDLSISRLKNQGAKPRKKKAAIGVRKKR